MLHAKRQVDINESGRNSSVCWKNDYPLTTHYLAR